MDHTDNTNRNQFIQVWRGIAAFLVIYYHFVNRLPSEALNSTRDASLMFYSGKVGVLIFFIISGYLIAGSLKGSRNLAAFYAKRLSRIWPLFILSATVVFIFLQFVQVPIVPSGPKQFFEGRHDFIDYLGNLFFLEDLGFNWMDGVYWSILVELKFYLWLGLLAWIRPADFGRWFAVFSIIFSGVEMWVDNFETGQFHLLSPLLNGLFVAQYLPFLAIGVLLYTRRDRNLLTLLLILAVLQTALKISTNPDFDLAHTIIFGLALTLVLFLDGALFNNKIFVTIGDYSYSWYLFHQMIGLTLIAGLVPTVGIDVAVVVALVATFMLSVLASWIAEWRYRKLFQAALMFVFTRIRLDRLPVAGASLPEAPMPVAGEQPRTA